MLRPLPALLIVSTVIVSATGLIVFFETGDERPETATAPPPLPATEPAVATEVWPLTVREWVAPPDEGRRRELPTLEDWDAGLEELRFHLTVLESRKQGAANSVRAYDTGRLRFFFANGIDYRDPTDPTVADFYTERESMMAEWEREFALREAHMADIGGVMLLCPVRYGHYWYLGNIMERASARVRYATLTEVHERILQMFGPKTGGPTQ